VLVSFLQGTREEVCSALKVLKSFAAPPSVAAEMSSRLAEAGLVEHCDDLIASYFTSYSEGGLELLRPRATPAFTLDLDTLLCGFEIMYQITSSPEARSRLLIHQEQQRQQQQQQQAGQAHAICGTLAAAYWLYCRHSSTESQRTQGAQVLICSSLFFMSCIIAVELRQAAQKDKKEFCCCKTLPP